MKSTLVIVKPDGLKKSLTGNILTRLSETKLEIIAAKVVKVSRELAAEHYRHLKEKPFFEDLLKYLQGEYHDRKKPQHPGIPTKKIKNPWKDRLRLR